MPKYQIETEDGHQYEIETEDQGNNQSLVTTKQPGMETTQLTDTSQPYSNNYKPGPPNPPQPPMTLKEMLGRGANALNGAVMGSPAGPLGMAGGAAIGLGQNPNPNPGMNMGATLGDLLANKFLPGANAPGVLARMFRGAGITGSMMGGATLGAQFDDMMNRGQGQDVQTPYGTIVSYGAATLPFQGLKALIPGNLSGSPLALARDKVTQATGTEIPLSFAQSSGFGSGFEDAMAAGSSASKNLAANQTQAAIDAVQKITGRPLSSIQGDVSKGANVVFDARKTLGAWVRNWKDRHSTIEESQVPTGVLDANGQPVMQTVSKTIRPNAVDWSDFQTQFGMSSMERDALFRAIHGDPAQFVDRMLSGKGQGELAGAARLRALMNMLPDESMQKLGVGVVQRMLGKYGAFEDTVNGPILRGNTFSRVVSDKMPQLKLILGGDRADALNTLAQVMKEADPASRTNPAAISQAKRSLSYMANKGAFTLMSVGGGAAAGTGVGGQHLLAAGAGMALGGATVIPLSVAIGSVMMNPGTAKIWEAAANGDASAVKALLRSIVSGAMTPTDETQPQSPASKLAGLFQ